MNKVTIKSLCLSLGMCLLLSASVAAEGIKFFKGSLEEAMAKAKEENKLVFVDAYAAWCGPCKMMDRSTLKDDEVGKFYNENFINVKLDVDKPDNAEFASQFNIRSIPFYAFLTSDTKLVHSGLGFIEVPQFLELGKKAQEFRQFLTMSEEDINGDINVAVKEFCEIMTPMIALSKEIELAGEDDVDKFQERVAKQMAIFEDYQNRYAGKMNNEKYMESFMVELEKQCEDVYTMMTEG